jgi:8-oxo-dGTP diphosphatase
LILIARYMAFDESVYRKGYSIGVGAVALCGEKVLLIRRALGHHVGSWTIPGGFVERSEKIDDAVKREVREEAGVEAEVEGLIAVRNYVIRKGEENSAYFVFLMSAKSEEAAPDGFETSMAGFFTRKEAFELEGLLPTARIMIDRVLDAKVKVFTAHEHPNFPAEEFVLYM